MPLETFERVLALARGGRHDRVSSRDCRRTWRGSPISSAGATRAPAARRRSAVRRVATPTASAKRASGSGACCGATISSRCSRARACAASAWSISGLPFARRQDEQGRVYFISNSSERDVDGWVPLARARRASDGLRSDARAARPRAHAPSADGGIEVRLQIPAGESLIVAAAPRAVAEPYPVYAAAGAPIAVERPVDGAIRRGRAVAPGRTDDRASRVVDGVRRRRRDASSPGTATYTTRSRGPRAARTHGSSISAACTTARACG